MTLNKDWKDDPDTSTPLSAAAMENLETRINSEITAAGTNVPTAGQKAALAGTNGTPGGGNQYVTDADPRNSNQRAPSSHASSHDHDGSDPLSAQQEAWQTIAFAAGTWDGSVSYMKDSLGFVHLRGDVFTLTTGGVVTAGTTLFTLPAGYRPVSTQKMMVGIIAASVAAVLITSAGVVTSANSISNGNTFSFANVSFRAEN